MVTLVDTRTMMVMSVHTDEGTVMYPANNNKESEFGMPEWDYD